MCVLTSSQMMQIAAGLGTSLRPTNVEDSTAGSCLRVDGHQFCIHQCLRNAFKGINSDTSAYSLGSPRLLPRPEGPDKFIARALSTEAGMQDEEENSREDYKVV